MDTSRWHGFVFPVHPGRQRLAGNVAVHASIVSHWPIERRADGPGAGYCSADTIRMGFSQQISACSDSDVQGQGRS